jgi:hypothetical protein
MCVVSSSRTHETRHARVVGSVATGVTGPAAPEKVRAYVVALVTCS